jgi:hypothetical protein
VLEINSVNKFFLYIKYPKAPIEITVIAIYHDLENIIIYRNMGKVVVMRHDDKIVKTRNVVKRSKNYINVWDSKEERKETYVTLN